MIIADNSRPSDRSLAFCVKITVQGTRLYLYYFKVKFAAHVYDPDNVAPRIRLSLWQHNYPLSSIQSII